MINRHQSAGGMRNLRQAEAGVVVAQVRVEGVGLHQAHVAGDLHLSAALARERIFGGGDERAADAPTPRPRIHHQRRDPPHRLRVLQHDPAVQRDDAGERAVGVIDDESVVSGGGPLLPVRLGDLRAGRMPQLDQQTRDLRSVVHGREADAGGLEHGTHYAGCEVLAKGVGAETADGWLDVRRDAPAEQDGATSDGSRPAAGATPNARLTSGRRDPSAAAGAIPDRG